MINTFSNILLFYIFYGYGSNVYNNLFLTIVVSFRYIIPFLMYIHYNRFQF